MAVSNTNDVCHIPTIFFLEMNLLKCSILSPCSTFTFTCQIRILSTNSTMQNLS